MFADETAGNLPLSLVEQDQILDVFEENASRIAVDRPRRLQKLRQAIDLVTLKELIVAFEKK